MTSLLNSNVTTGLMSAATHAQLSRFCTGLYKIAKSKGDEGAMERAMGYANDYRSKAMTDKKQAGEALIESTKEARREEKLEQEQRLEAQRAESRAEAKAVQDAAAENVSQPAAVLELSQTYSFGAQDGAATAQTDASQPSPAVTKPAKTAQAPVPDVMAHTPAMSGNGAVSPSTAGGAVSSIDIKI